jgi:hypothetical protein
MIPQSELQILTLLIYIGTRGYMGSACERSEIGLVSRARAARKHDEDPLHLNEFLE